MFCLARIPAKNTALLASLKLLVSGNRGTDCSGIGSAVAMGSLTNGELGAV